MVLWLLLLCSFIRPLSFALLLRNKPVLKVKKLSWSTCSVTNYPMARKVFVNITLLHFVQTFKWYQFSDSCCSDSLRGKSWNGRGACSITVLAGTHNQQIDVGGYSKLKNGKLILIFRIIFDTFNVSVWILSNLLYWRLLFDRLLLLLDYQIYIVELADMSVMNVY